MNNKKSLLPYANLTLHIASHYFKWDWQPTKSGITIILVQTKCYSKAAEVRLGVMWKKVSMFVSTPDCRAKS